MLKFRNCSDFKTESWKNKDNIGNKMASYTKSIGYCSVCFRSRKYICIICDFPICSIYFAPEKDGNFRGWKAGRIVGYCENCPETPPSRSHAHEAFPVSLGEVPSKEVQRDIDKNLLLRFV